MAVRVLAIGDMTRWRETGRALPLDSHVVFADFQHLTDALLSETAPDIVLAPLICPSFDCIDIAQLLHGYGFSGRLRIVAPRLPDPAIVLRELQVFCPGIDLDFAPDELLSLAEH